MCAVFVALTVTLEWVVSSGVVI